MYNKAKKARLHVSGTLKDPIKGALRAKFNDFLGPDIVLELLISWLLVTRHLYIERYLRAVWEIKIPLDYGFRPLIESVILNFT